MMSNGPMPGPLGLGYDKAYINRKHDEFADRSFPFPKYDYIFEKTYGMMIYQEQLMRLASDMCGFDDIKTDILRKATGKKDENLLNSLKGDFINGAIANGENREALEEFWNSMLEFARYSFNASHSYSYAHLSYFTAWAKANYPHEFFTAVISLEDDPDQKVAYIQNARINKINVRPPDINFSSSDFSISPNKDIIFGFNGIKGLGPAAITKILELRPFDSFEDFVFKTINERTITSKVMETLIYVGAFDSLGYRRSVLIKNYQAYVNEAKIAVAGTIGATASKKARTEALKGISYTNFDTVKTKLFDEEFPDFTIVQKLNYEKQFIGIHITGSPFDLLKQSVPTMRLYTSQMVSNAMENAPKTGLKLQVAIMPSKIKKHITANGREMAFVDGLDANGSSISMVVFGLDANTKAFEEIMSSINTDSIFIANTVCTIGNRGISIVAKSFIDGGPLIEEKFKADNLFHGLNIYIKNIELSNNWISASKKILSLINSHPGNGRIRIHVVTDDNLVFLLKEIKGVALSMEFLKSIKNLEDVMSELF